MPESEGSAGRDQPGSDQPSHDALATRFHSTSDNHSRSHYSATDDPATR